MTILDLQRRLAEIGRIRIGQQVPTGNGRSRPAKLATFRLTSPDRLRIQHAAGLYGGQPTEWQAPAGPQWEVVTESDALNVIVPPSDMAFSQHYELWSGGGCQRRCDGRIESISQGPCVCDPDERECKIHTRLSVMLRDLPGLGVWRIDTSGFYAALELQGAVEVMQLAASRGQMLPARLRLEQRQIKRAGQGVKRFAVPVLDVEISPAQLFGSAGPTQITAGQPAERLQINGAAGDQASGPVDASAPLTPVPESVPEAPAPSVAEQAAATKTKPKRRNAAATVPATGRAPRTAAQAARQQTAPAAAPEALDLSQDRAVTMDQLKKLHAQLNDLGVTERPDKLTTVGLLAGRELATSNDLTIREASRVIDLLDQVLASGQPAEALDMALANAEQRTAAEPGAEPPAERAPAALITKIKRQLADLLVTKPAEQLRILGQVAGRHIAAFADLTTAEGQRAAELFVRAGHAEQPGRALDQLLIELESGSDGESRG